MYPLLVSLTVAYFLIASVTTLDVRLLQAKRTGALPPDQPLLPPWIGLLHWAQWGVFLALLLLHWKYALVVFVVKVALQRLPVLETIGNLLLTTLRKRA